MTFIPSSPVFVTLFYLSLLIPTPNPTQFDSPIFAFDQHSDSHEFFTGGKEAVPQVSEGNNIFYGVWFFMGFVSDFDVSILTTREAEHARPPCAFYLVPPYWPRRGTRADGRRRPYFSPEQQHPSKHPRCPDDNKKCNNNKQWHCLVC